MLASPGRYSFGELDTVVPAYAATVHKSQGSEYPVVVIPVLTQHYAMLRRNLLYTGVKRGKRLVELVGQKKAVAIAVRNVSGRRRWSKLDERLSGPAADRASDSTGGVGSSTGGTRNASCMRSESGSASSIWPCIRTRPGSSSSDGTPRRTAERGGGPPGDVRLSGLHALLPEDQERAVRARAQARCEAGEAHSAAHRRRSTAAHAPRPP